MRTILTEQGTMLEYKEGHVLPEDFKKKWVKALKSGDYIQGKGMLARHYSMLGDDDSIATEYCCLGVACELAKDNVDLMMLVQFPKKESNVPELIKEGDVPVFLAEMNDDEGWSFNEIADWIEDNL